MAWEHLSVTKAHYVYLILGGYTSLFMLCSSIIKEKFYIGEATVATVVGVIFGPHCADLINPITWGNTDLITLEFSRIVLVVQCFAVGVELPKYYMEKHWRSVTFLLVPVMTFGWLMTSLFIWAVFHEWANWLDCLCIAACVTATDPVLASSVVGKGKFAKRVPKHLRDLLSAESGCNDGMAFPFIYLALYIIRYKGHPDKVALHWFCYTILYECLFGCIYGVAVGYAARRLIRYAHEKDYIDRESFLVFYFVLALFCAGSGSILGMDDLLVGFACGVGFSNDGWFTEKTEESSVSNVIDLLINLAFFVYFGTIIPWKQYNAGYLGLDVWRLVVIAFLVLFFRRIPIMMALKPVIPDIKTWREALFAGHFGPIGVGAIFVAILARAELETESTTPLAVLPPPGFEHDNVIELIWPITTFLVMTSILIHGSSIAVFTLGKHINTLTLTMSYTKGSEDPNWMERLPRIQSRSKSQMSAAKSEESFDEKSEQVPPGMLPTAMRGKLLRRLKPEDDPSQQGARTSRKHKESSHGYGGPVSDSAIRPRTKQPSPSPADRSDSDTLAMKSSESPPSSDEKQERVQGGDDEAEIFEEGDQTVYEDKEGNVLEVQETHEQDELTRQESELQEGKRVMRQHSADQYGGMAPGLDERSGDRDHHTDDPHTGTGGKFEGELKAAENELKDKLAGMGKKPERPGQGWRDGLRKMSTMGFIPKREDGEKPEKKPEPERKHGPARAYQYGNTIIVEDEDGEVINKYDIPAPESTQNTGQGQNTGHRLRQMSRMLGIGPKDTAAQGAAHPEDAEIRATSPLAEKGEAAAQGGEEEELRFTTGGRRMSKAEFIDHIRDMDPKRRVQAVENSNAPEPVKREARKEAREQAGLTRKETLTDVPVVHEQPEEEADGDRDQRPSLAAVQRSDTSDTNELRLVDSGGMNVPFHNVSNDLRNYQLSSGANTETAAERRRRLAAQRSESGEDSEDDGTDRVPPKAQASSSQQGRELSESGETAAERRRREGALGLHHQDESSDSEDDNSPRDVPQKQNIRFADQSRPQPEPETPKPTKRTSTLRWGKNTGR